MGLTSGAHTKSQLLCSMLLLSLWQVSTNSSLGHLLPCDLISIQGQAVTQASLIRILYLLGQWLSRELTHDPKWANRTSSSGLIRAVRKEAASALGFQTLWHKTPKSCQSLLAFLASRKPSKNDDNAQEEREEMGSYWHHLYQGSAFLEVTHSVRTFLSCK